MYRNLFCLIVGCSILAVTSTAWAADKGTFGFGLGGTFSYTSTSNELATDQTVDNSTLFLRFNPRAEYFVAKNIPIVVRAGVLSRSLDRGIDNANETDAIVTLGTGYHIYLNQRFSVIVEGEVGGYVGSSTRTIEVVDTTIDESTDTRGLAFGGGLNFAWMLGRHAQLRAGVDYTGLVGSESVERSDETLDAATNSVGLSLGFVYFF